MKALKKQSLTNGVLNPIVFGPHSFKFKKSFGKLNLMPKNKWKGHFWPFLKLKQSFLIENKTTNLHTDRKLHQNQLCGYFTDFDAALEALKRPE